MAQETTGKELSNELVGDIRQRAGSGSAYGQALHYRLVRDPVWATWIGVVVGLPGIRAPLPDRRDHLGAMAGLPPEASHGA